MKSVSAQGKAGNDPEHISRVIDRVIDSLGHPRRPGPNPITLGVATDLLKYALRFPGTPRKARRAVHIAIDLIEGRWRVGGAA